MEDIALAFVENLPEELALFDDVFGLKIHPPELTYEAWEEKCLDENGLKVMEVADLQAEYQMYLKDEMLRLRGEIDTLLHRIDVLIENADPDTRAQLEALKDDLYWVTFDENGKIEREGGLRVDLNRGIWLLEHYDFYKKELSYLVPLDKNDQFTDWVKRVQKMSPEQVLSEAYYPTTLRRLITIPDLTKGRALIA